MLEIIEPNPCNLRVLPTRVGMVRPDWRTEPEVMSSPHPRGDGPLFLLLEQIDLGFSPPAWGWSVINDGGPAFPVVLPTRVVMVRG